jgi:hypothetical protein
VAVFLFASITLSNLEASANAKSCYICNAENKPLCNINQTTLTLKAVQTTGAGQRHKTFSRDQLLKSKAVRKFLDETNCRQ